MYPEETSTEGQVMGIIGIVLGIISLIVAFIPCVGIVAIFPGILAIVFSIISVIQAGKGNGKKAIGITALVVSILSVLVAILWVLLISGSLMVSQVFNRSGQNEIIGKEFKEAFEQELGSDVGRKALSDSLVKALKDLEKDLDTLDTKKPIDRESARKAGEAAAKALKKVAKEITDTKKDTGTLVPPKK